MSKRPAALKPSEYPRYTRKDVEDLYDILYSLQDINESLKVRSPVFARLDRLLKRRKL